LRKRIENHRNAVVDAKLSKWQRALAETYLLSSHGETSPRFREVSAQLLAAIHADKAPDKHTATVEGMFERLALTFERTARTVADANSQTATGDPVETPVKAI
jgi:gamma-glutamyl phosphate reductase